MSLILKNITLRNFLSIGAVCQAVSFDKKELTLILGDNLDLGGDGARNGTGKTTLIQGLSYALFGTPINNIRKDNLVNRTNAKGMLVTLEFSANGVEYKIERGRKPNILKFYINNVAQKDEDTAQGENRATQEAIEKVIHMSPDMFKHIVALNTYSEPFLAMKANEQRDIIEQLLGITLLSEKAEVIKVMLRDTKDSIQAEEFRVKAVEEANKRVKEQIEGMKRRHMLWNKKHDEDLAGLALQYDDLSKIDIDKELASHKDLAIYNEKKKQQITYESILARQTAWHQKSDKDVSVLEKELKKLNTIDIDVELQAHKDLTAYKQKQKDIDILTKLVERCVSDAAKETAIIASITKEIKELEDHKCYACGQEFHDDKHQIVLDGKRKALLDAVSQALLTNNQCKEHTNAIALLGELGDKPKPHYKTEAEAIRHSSEIDNVQQQITAKKGETDPYADQLTECPADPGPMPSTHYDTESAAIEHRSKTANLVEQITNKHSEVDPYSEQIVEMESKALQEVKFDTINTLTKTMEHQKFLLDLLTSKDSFVRKRIIDQNLAYLNARLTHYLDKIGLPHDVTFKNDLQVEIKELGREMDFHNLSRGEMNRVILSLSWAFRDVWENLYCPINVLFIDELLDNGTDAVGMENSLGILKDMSRRRQKSIWLVSHKDELVSRVGSVLRVVKEGGFTSYSTSTDIA